MAPLGSFKNIVRMAKIDSVNYDKQIVLIKYLDRPDPTPYACAIPHPAVFNNGAGIFVYPTKGSVVTVDSTYKEAPIIVSSIPQSAFTSDLTKASNTKNFFTSDAAYPALKDGEIAISTLHSELLFNNSGGVDLSFGDKCVSYNKLGQISEFVKDKYFISSAGFKISGEIKRDLRLKSKEIESSQDKLAGFEYDAVLSKIGRNPAFETAVVTSVISGHVATFRNPALVENREVVYEFSREYQVGTVEEESLRIDAKTSIDLNQRNRRDLARTDTLNLNHVAINNLIEKVQGNLVDRYGNILDLNRNVINYKLINNDLTGARIVSEEKLLRRGVKFHLEINSRKEPSLKPAYDTLGPDGYEKIGAFHSRWSVDVDGEGLTKINIPASSDQGNIPLLTRFSNTALRSIGKSTDIEKEYPNPKTTTFKDETHTDVIHLAFGDKSGAGTPVSDDYSPSNDGDRFAKSEKIKYRTAYHDILKTAESLFDFPDVPLVLSEPLQNGLLDGRGANAGGRSLHSNLDGSLELNIGKDNYGGKSIVLDTSGGIISRIGKDLNNNSVVSELDGNIRLKIGGGHIETETKVDQPSVKIFVESVGKQGTRVDVIEINEKGIFIRGAADKNIVIESQANLVLKAAKQVLVQAEGIFMYGESDEDGSVISGERLLQKSGKMVP